MGWNLKQQQQQPLSAGMQARQEQCPHGGSDSASADFCAANEGPELPPLNGCAPVLCVFLILLCVVLYVTIPPLPG